MRRICWRLALHFISQYNGDFFSVLEQWNDQFALSLNEMLALFKLVPLAFGVYNHLTSRIDVHKMVPSARPKTVVEEIK